MSSKVYMPIVYYYTEFFFFGFLTSIRLECFAFRFLNCFILAKAVIIRILEYECKRKKTYFSVRKSYWKKILIVKNII